MLKLTSSFYRCIIVSCERLSCKSQLRKLGDGRGRRALCAAQQALPARRQLHSSPLLRECQESQIMLPTLFDTAEQMSQSTKPTSDHFSCGGNFIVSSTDVSPSYSGVSEADQDPLIKDVLPDSTLAPDFRCWEPVYHPVDPAYFASMHQKGCSSSAFQFRVVSYNVLAQCLLECHPYLYKQCSPENLKWEVRASRLYDEICNLEPDVICLQEVQASHRALAPFARLEARGFGAVYKQKTGARRDGCAIYYRKDKFALIDHAHVEFFQPAVSVLNRDNVGLMVKLAPLGARSRPLVVATTHLLYNPKRSDVRLAQMQLFLAEIDRFSYIAGTEGSHLPIIMTGDFNSPPESSVIELLDNGCVSAIEYRDNSNWEQIGVTDDCQHLSVHLNRQEGRPTSATSTQIYNSAYSDSFGCSQRARTPFGELFRRTRLRHALRLSSVYRRYTERGPEASSYQGDWLTVDYMYFSSHNLRLVSRLRLPTAAECEALGALPDAHFASDHLALAAAFELYPADDYL